MAYLAVHYDGKVASRIRLDGLTVIGRSADCDIVLHDESVSRRHCAVERRAHGWVITDLDSRNGTSVGGVPVGTLGLVDGDEVTAGAVLLRFYKGNPIERRPLEPEQAIAPHRKCVDENAETKVIDTKRLPPRPMPRLWDEITSLG